MPNKTYIPQREPELLEWSNNLAAQLTADPAAYGQTVESLADFTAAQTAFAAAYATANDPTTRTKANIAEKNTKKTEMLQVIRPLVQTLQNWSGMTNQKRDILEIPVRDYEPTPIGPPEVMPVLRVAAVNGRVLDLELRREDGTTKRKPQGVRGCWLYTHVGENPPTDLQAWKFEGGSTKSNPQIVFPETVAPGTQVWVTALWVNPTDQPGPACAPVKTHINFNGLNQAA